MSSELRALLDRINDVEATIARIARSTDDVTSLASRLTIESLENRRDSLRDELARVTRHESVEICDYRLVPEGIGSYAIAGISSALHDFQELVTVVFDAIVNERPKQKARVDADIAAKTRFDFGFAYAGSLGIALTIGNERLLLGDSELDMTIDTVFGLVKVTTPEQVKEIDKKYGRATVRKLYEWSRTHRDYDFAVDIQWKREGETRYGVMVQPAEVDQICRIIEATPLDAVEPVELIGMLASWDSVHRDFILIVPDEGVELVRGKFAESLDAQQAITVLGKRYRLSLLKHTTTSYISDKQDINWELVAISESN